VWKQLGLSGLEQLGVQPRHDACCVACAVFEVDTDNDALASDPAG
jgi:hypothetical protein